MLDRFLGGANARFEFDDFNIDLQKRLAAYVDGGEAPPSPYPTVGISLRLRLDDDDLSNVGNHVIMDLNPDNRWIVLDFLYHVPEKSLQVLHRDYKAHSGP